MPKYGGTSYIDKLEEAAGISTPKIAPAQKGFTAPPYTGPRPSTTPGESVARKLKVYKLGKTYPLSDIPLTPRAKGGPVSPSRPNVMRMKGAPLVGFMPGTKKSKKGKKRVAI